MARPAGSSAVSPYDHVLAAAVIVGRRLIAACRGCARLCRQLTVELLCRRRQSAAAQPDLQRRRRHMPASMYIERPSDGTAHARCQASTTSGDHHRSLTSSTTASLYMTFYFYFFLPSPRKLFYSLVCWFVCLTGLLRSQSSQKDELDKMEIN